MRKTILCFVCIAMACMFYTSCSNKSDNIVNVNLYGADLQVRFDNSKRGTEVADSSREAVGQCLAWIEAASKNTLEDCQRIKQELNLSDWAYLKMIDRVAVACLDSTREASLMAASLLNRSGYSAKVGIGDNGQWQMLYYSDAFTYGKTYFMIDNKWYYAYGDTLTAKNMKTLALPTAEGKPINFRYQGDMKLPYQPTEARTITSTMNKDFSFTVRVNKNLIDYYGDLPAASYGDDFITRWTNLAAYPIGQELRDSLVSQMKEAVKGRTQLDAVQQILWWVQTGLEFQYDEEIWGYDRAFSADETLFYPYADAEDRSILLARLVRDVTGLDVVLVYYPGHLATAVCFTEADVKGDFLTVDNRRFVICDPTYIGSNVGETMPSMKGQETIVRMVE